MAFDIIAKLIICFSLFLSFSLLGSVARDSLNALETSPDREMDRKKESISNGKEKKELTKLPKPPVPEGLISNIREVSACCLTHTENSATPADLE